MPARPPRPRAPAGAPPPVADPARPAADPALLAADLLAWYDRHRRALPWRARPGEVADPYRVWLSEVMLQQTTVAAARGHFERFTARWPTLGALAAAEDAEVMAAWAGLGYYARARHLLACARRVVAEHDGRLPDAEGALRALPGLGDYAAAAVAAIAFGRPAVVVDGNVERVVARLVALPAPPKRARAAVRALVGAMVPADRPGDFAQATMDLGATVCTPRRPACALCPWREPCAARALARQECFPVKEPKAAGAPRRGAAFAALRADGLVLVRTRPPRGLLGGTIELPGSAWRAEGEAGGDEAGGDGAGGDHPAGAAEEAAAAPLPAAWERVGEVAHGFSHFPLTLSVHRAAVPAGTPAPEGSFWMPLAEALAAMPTAARKALALAAGAGERRDGSR